MSLYLPSSETSALTELDPEFEPVPPSSPPIHTPVATRRQRQTPQEKLQKYLHILREDNMSVADFLHVPNQGTRGPTRARSSASWL